MMMFVVVLCSTCSSTSNDMTFDAFTLAKRSHTEKFFFRFLYTLTRDRYHSFLFFVEFSSVSSVSAPAARCMHRASHRGK
jgi:hypothetical protein